MLLAVILGLLAGFLFAASASLQQRAARQTAAQPTDTPLAGRSVLRPLFALVRRLLRNRLWLTGWLTNLLGFVTQAVALHVGSVALVQPLLVSQLLFALPMATAWARRWPTVMDWVGAAAISGGLVIFLAVRGVATLSGEPDRGRVILAGLFTVGLVCALVVASAGRPALVHATLIAIAAGLCFAMTAVLIKLTMADLVERGIPATAVDWPGYALAVCTFTGLVLEQGAFAAGSLPAAVAAMTITNPIAGYLAGVLAFHVMPPTSPGVLAAIAGSGALLVAGVVALAHSPTMRPEAVAGTSYPVHAGSAGSRTS
jgi:drug/metabolite transporter (DMT)-like permease